MKRILPLCLLLAVIAATASAAESDPAASRPQLQIINGSAQPIDVFWLKSAGDRVPSGSVEPAMDQIITTTLGHRFIIVGRKDKAEAAITASVPVQAFRFLGAAVTARGAAPEGRVTSPPDGFGIPPFYAKFISARGYPIVASGRVSDFALMEAADLVDQMLAHRPDVRAAMIQSGSRMCIHAYDEFTTDLPEFARLTPKDYWDARARGLGGSRTDPYCSCAEENLLGYPGDPYAAECILIHEFAHNIHLRGVANVDPTFDRRVKETYDRAMAQSLWNGKYASVNHHEYFAEGVQSWFDDNRENDHDHNHVDTRAELLDYDPGLAALCREVFGDTVLKYTKPSTRLTGHLAGYDPAQAPTFAWPERLRQTREGIRHKAERRSRAAENAAQ